jgi:hypothetical protein
LVRNQAAEYLRRGIEAVKTAATYVFSEQPDVLALYPTLFKKQRRRASDIPVAPDDRQDGEADLGNTELSDGAMAEIYDPVSSRCNGVLANAPTATSPADSSLIF